MTSERDETERRAAAAHDASDGRDDEACFEPSADVVVERVEGELVLLDLQRNEVFGLNEVGALVWERVAEGATLRAALDAVLEAFEVDEATARGDVRALVAALYARGLLRPRAAGAAR